LGNFLAPDSFPAELAPNESVNVCAEYKIVEYSASTQHTEVLEV